MFSRSNAVRSFRRLAQVQFLSAVAAISFITMPALADDQPASVDAPVQQTEQPVAEPAPTPGVCAAPQITRAQFEELMTEAVGAARSFATQAFSAIETRTASSETPNPLASDSAKPDSDSPAPEATPLSDVKIKQAEIDAINAQIEEEKARSARR
ncbi:MAG TPA: hypothetical protein VFE47_29350, partial [Tepidisphaeraceae bacterium]|nr:hypothetical protein [Tepidisphaeraceae bacterium]